jgi:hypothetical protein
MQVLLSGSAVTGEPWHAFVIGRSAQGREIRVLRLGTGDADAKPGVLIVGAADARQQYAAELAEDVAAEIAGAAAADPTLLDAVTFYVLPQPSPDAAQRRFSSPLWESGASFTPTDDDRDGAVDEDGPEDLNGDGLITMMRVIDPAGGYLPHPLDARVLISVKPENGELGQWALYVEGVDNDEDERWNEDGHGGVDLNRNFPFDYPFFEPGAGEYQCCEPESRALADWLCERSNIAVVMTLSGGDNLYSLWPTGQDLGEVSTSLRAADEPYCKKIAKQYKELSGREGEPPASDQRGSLLKWAYFHYGRWAVGVSPWWIEAERKADEEKEGDTSEEEAATDLQESEAEVNAENQVEPAWDVKDKRGGYELRALKSFEQHGIEGFVPWQRVEHPDFSGKLVEVGGFKPYSILTPSESELEGLAEKQGEFALDLARMLPKVSLNDVRVEMLGGGVYRVTCAIVNTGSLPTVSEMGELTRAPYPLQLTLELPAAAELVTGLAREKLPRLPGGGGSVERGWLISAPRGATVKLQVHSPSVGSAAASVSLEGNK